MAVNKGAHMVMKLVPEPVDFLIPTTDIKVIYTESNGVQIYLDVQTQEDFKTNNYQEWMLCFSVVAELKCTTLNFFESHFDDIQIEHLTSEIDFWQKHQYHSNPLFYQVANSGVLHEKGKTFDPNNKLNLKHYLIVGYDSYVEVIAAKYQSQRVV